MANGSIIRSQLLQIRDLLDVPMVLVNHLYSLLPDGSEAAGRVELTKILQGISDDLGVGMFDTRTVIEEHGVECSLVDQNHYRPEVELSVGERLAEVARRQRS